MHKICTYSIVVIQLLVPVFPGGNRMVYVPVVSPVTIGHLKVPVTATCVVGGQTVVHHVYIDVSRLPVYIYNILNVCI